MNHARRVLKQELEILTDTRRQVMADRDLPGRSEMLVELSCEINEVRQALVLLAPVVARPAVARPASAAEARA